jgi:phytoene dehydrogenase-like protein
MFGPLLLISFGIEEPLSEASSLLVLDRVPRFHVGGGVDDHLYLRIFNDEETVAPKGSTVVQALLSTDYHYWATRGGGYESAKRRIAEAVLRAIDAELPGVAAAVRMTDVATPITYWRATRSWRGAYEGFRFNGASWFGHIDKRLDGLSHFYLAGQWVEPGGGVPMSLLSGRQAAQLVCADAGRTFVPGMSGV